MLPYASYILQNKSTRYFYDLLTRSTTTVTSTVILCNSPSTSANFSSRYFFFSSLYINEPLYLNFYRRDRIVPCITCASSATTNRTGLRTFIAAHASRSRPAFRCNDRYLVTGTRTDEKRCESSSTSEMERWLGQRDAARIRFTVRTLAIL